MTRRIVFVIGLALSLCVLTSGRVFGEPATAEADQQKAAAPADQPKPEDVLRRMAEYYGKLPAFSCRAESVIEITEKGGYNRMVTKMAIRLERPNRLAFVVDEGVMGMTVVSDGKQLTQYLPIMNRYIVKEAPADFAAMTDIGAPISLTMLGMAGEVIPMANGDDFYKQLMDGVTKSEYVGAEKIGDVQCHHLRFSQEDFDWDIWIEDGERPLVHKVVPDLSKQLTGGNADPQLEGVKMEYVVTLTDWNVEPKFTDADFAFTPPANAEQVESLFENVEEGPHPALGQPAPPFTTTDVEEQPFNLQDHLGKDVIMLDFWATWCPPCVEGLPKVNEVAKKFEGKPVLFKAVNAAEDAETIKEFLKTSELDAPVVLDPQGEIAQLYQVQGIPQTVLIGKDGKVQVVHVGFSDRMPDELSKAIEELLAGKDLASEALAKFEEREQRREKEAGVDAASTETAPPAEPPSDADEAAGESN